MKRKIEGYYKVNNRH